MFFANHFYLINWEKKKRENPYLSDHLPYTPETDSFVCRNGKRLVHVGKRKYVTEARYETTRDYYRCEDCIDCPYATERSEFLSYYGETGKASFVMTR